MTSKLSVNMAYFCTNLVIIMQLSFVKQGWCFPTYFPNFFLKSLQRSFENAHFPNMRDKVNMERPEKAQCKHNNAGAYTHTSL